MNLLINLFEDEKFDYVLNFAAESHVDRSITNPEIFVQTNIQGTLVLLMLLKNISVKKYLQVSTDEVYGTLGETGYFTEKHHLLQIAHIVQVKQVLIFCSCLS